MPELTKYEQDQIVAIRKWKEEEPGVVSKSLGKVMAPVGWMIRKIIPEKAMVGALDFANYIAEFTADNGDLLRDGGVSRIDQLRTRGLDVSDKLADSVRNWAVGMAAGEGGLMGVWGMAALAVDIPAIITLALRTSHKIGLCYGYECKSEYDKQYILNILAASGANTLQEKAAAIATLKSIEVTIAKTTWKRMTQIAAQRQLSKEGAIISLRTLAKNLGINITKRKAAQAIPVVGAAVGATVNGWYIKDVSRAARRQFQERWLIDNNKIIDV